MVLIGSCKETRQSGLSPGKEVQYVSGNFLSSHFFTSLMVMGVMVVLHWVKPLGIAHSASARKSHRLRAIEKALALTS